MSLCILGVLDLVILVNFLRLFIKLPFGKKREERGKKMVWRGDVVVVVELSEPKNQEKKGKHQPSKNMDRGSKLEIKWQQRYNK